MWDVRSFNCLPQAVDTCLGVGHWVLGSARRNCVGARVSCVSLRGGPEPLSPSRREVHNHAPNGTVNIPIPTIPTKMGGEFTSQDGINHIGFDHIHSPIPETGHDWRPPRAPVSSAITGPVKSKASDTSAKPVSLKIGGLKPLQWMCPPQNGIAGATHGHQLRWAHQTHPVCSTPRIFGRTRARLTKNSCRA